MRDISERVSSPVAARARAAPAAGGVAPGAGVEDGGATWATVVGRNIVSRTASMGSEVDAPAMAAAPPATSAPVFATDPAVDRNNAAPITTPTAQTKPPWRPSLN